MVRLTLVLTGKGSISLGSITVCSMSIRTLICVHILTIHCGKIYTFNWCSLLHFWKIDKCGNFRIEWTIQLFWLAECDENAVSTTCLHTWTRAFYHSINGSGSIVLDDVASVTLTVCWSAYCLYCVGLCCAQHALTCMLLWFQ